MLEVTLDFKSEKENPLYIQLASFIKQEMAVGNIPAGEKLPSKRNLAIHLGVSVNTIQAAFNQLVAEGYVRSEQRKGFYVQEVEELIGDSVPSSQTAKKEKNLQYKIDFNSGHVDLQQFPYSVWRKLSVKSLYLDGSELFYNGNPQGESCLREQIAQYLFQSRGVRCSADQILLGAGTQVLTGLLCMVIGREKTYALESPGFHRTRVALQDQGVDVELIPVEEEGLSVKELASSKAEVVFVTPSHQFPYGMVMPISRRVELLNWAEEQHGYIVEDDYDSEYRYKGKPIPSLQGLDSNGRVIYMGTFSKSLIPSIRISYLVLPSSLVEKYRTNFSLYKQTVSRLHQDTLFRFMSNGHWATHLNKMRTLYRKKQARLLAAIQEDLGECVTTIGEKSGLHIILNVQNGMSENELIASASRNGMKVYPTSVYYGGERERTEPEVLLGFGGLSELEIEEGIRLLKESWGL